MLDNSDYEDVDIDEDACEQMTYDQSMREFKTKHQNFNPMRRKLLNYDVLQQMINDRRFAGRKSPNKIKSNECIEVAIKRVLDHKDEEQIYYKGLNAMRCVTVITITTEHNTYLETSELSLPKITILSIVTRAIRFV